MLRWSAVLGVLKDAQRNGDRLTLTLRGGAGTVRGFIPTPYSGFTENQITLATRDKYPTVYHVDLGEVAVITVAPA